MKSICHRERSLSEATKLLSLVYLRDFGFMRGEARANSEVNNPGK